MPSEIKEIMKKARNDFVHKISVAGWREAFDEHIVWIKQTFRIVLISLALCCVYYAYVLVQRCLNQRYADEISDILGSDSLPLSNVTICAQVYFNETFVRQNVTIPESVRSKLMDDQMNEFYRQLTLFLSIVSRPRSLDPAFLAYFPKLLQANPQMHDFSNFAGSAFPSCQHMLKRCWFDGVEFDCCERAVQSFDDDGICYVLALNFDSDNAVPDPRTLRQSLPGPTGGLTVEASLDVQQFPWLEDDAPNGFKVLVRPTPFTPAASPLGAPDGAETFVEVTPSKRRLITNCTGEKHLSMPGGQFMYYDPEGESCGVREFMRVMHEFLACHAPIYLYRPNSTEVCNPHVIFFASSTFNAADLERKFEGFKAYGTGNVKFRGNGISENLKKVEAGWRRALSDKARCPYHCTYWTYTSSASFFYLQRADPAPAKREMFSKIHVYYADFGYRQHVEVKEMTEYLAFYAFCNIFILYLGMSVISFFHLAFYVPYYVYVLRKYGPPRPSVRKSQVMPLPLKE